jgi:hypothetical protein
MNIFNIENAFKKKKEKGWDTLYWVIDLHDTIIKGRYTEMNENPEFYPYAKTVLQNLSHRTDTKLILWTSSHNKSIDDILLWFESQLIHFDFINDNLECKSDNIKNFARKFYFNVLLDDKAGFNGEVDWLLVENELIRIGEWQ